MIWNMNMKGYVNSKRFWRPNVSIYQTAGNAKKKLVSPKPKERYNVVRSENPA